MNPINNDDQSIMIVACGQRLIWTKTGRKFPAYLVKLCVPIVTDHNSLPTSFSASSSSIVYVWKSKRDFLLIARAAKKYHISFPKAALAKLGESYPWVRPIPDASLDETLQHLGESCSDINNYSNHMKKSLHKLDQFLEKIQEKSSELEHRENSDSPLVAAWYAFLNNTLPGSILDSDTNTSNRKMNKYNEEEIDCQRGTALGQYFASDENVQYVVETAFSFLLQTLRLDVQNCIFVEPSCGDGRILIEICRKLIKLGIGKIRVIGYDIDPSACEASLQRVQSIDKNIPIVCADFLSLTKENLMSDLYRTNESIKEDQIKVIIIGGPPYTLGRGKNIKRDLPSKFIVHSTKVMDAKIVSFILPNRCRKEEFIDEVRRKIGDMNYPECKKTKLESTQRYVNHSSISCESNDLQNSKFHFRGIDGQAVDQPSILQTWFFPEIN